MKAQSPQNSSLKIIVYEHVSGGGYAGQPLPMNVLTEGFGMLRSFIADLKTAGHKTTVLIDERISRLNPPLEADCVIPILYPEEPRRFLSNIVHINDALYVIAPETRQTLQGMVNFVESTGKISLNCKSSIIGKVADKATLYKCLQDKGFPIPKTLTLDLNYSLAKILQAIKNEFDYPIVIKPTDGTGSSGLSIIKEENQVKSAIAKIKDVSTTKLFIIQEYVNGAAASVSVISNGKKALALSLNRQIVTIAEPNSESRYEGGCIPFNHPLKKDATFLAQKVVESFTRLRGYVGVDVVLAPDAIFVVDVNPRLTTSYVGLRKVASFNVAEALINAVLHGKLPSKTVNYGFACFSKMENLKATMSAFQEASALGSVISPPFPIDNAKSCALLIGEGDEPDKAKLRLEEAKKQLVNIVAEGKTLG